MSTDPVIVQLYGGPFDGTQHELMHVDELRNPAGEPRVPDRIGLAVGDPPNKRAWYERDATGRYQHAGTEPIR